MRVLAIIGHSLRLGAMTFKRVITKLLYDNVTIGKGVMIEPSVTIVKGGGKLIIHDNVKIGKYCYIDVNKHVEIGAGTLLAPFAFIIDQDHDISCMQLSRNEYIREPVIIGANCWIGARAIILKGVKIGDNAVVGAGSVVTKDVPKNAIVCGVPARVVRHRNRAGNAAGS